jgi:hypothetical protein
LFCTKYRKQGTIIIAVSAGLDRIFSGISVIRPFNPLLRTRISVLHNATFKKFRFSTITTMDVVRA